MFKCWSWRIFGQAKNIAILTFFIVTFLPSSAFSGTFTAFGPQDIVKENKRHQVNVYNFSIQNPNTLYYLEIYNGGMDSDGTQEEEILEFPFGKKGKGFPWFSLDHHRQWNKVFVRLKKRFSFIRRNFKLVPTAEIKLNGNKIIGQRDFNRKFLYLEKSIKLGIDNELRVMLRGKPGSMLTFRIVGIDNDPPAISAAINPPPNAAGWNKEDVTVSFTCEDGLSRVVSCPDPVVVSQEGAGQVVSGTVEDEAGNTATTSATINLDKTAPEVSASSSPLPNASDWNNSDVVVTFDGTDGLSGIDTVTPPTTVTTEGANQIITGTAVDVAGNSSSTSVTLNIDKTPPLLSLLEPDSNLVTNDPILSVSGTVTDAYPVQRVLVNGAPVGFAGGEFHMDVPLSEGENPVSVQSTDMAGNSSQLTRTVTYIETVETFSPTPLSFINIPGFARGIAVQGDYVFIAGGPNGIYVVDVSDRNTPTIVQSLDTPGNAMDIKVRGSRAYIADQSGGLQIIDISNPINPVLISSLDTLGFPRALAVSGNLVLLGDPVSGLQIIDVYDSENPFLLGEIQLPGQIIGLDVFGHIAITATGVDGLQVVDITNPSNPKIIGNLDTPGEARRVVIDGHVAYVADRTRGLQVVDFSDPTDPLLIGSSSTAAGGDVLDIVQSGNAIFGAIINSSNVVPIFDVSDPADPSDVGQIDFSSFPDDSGIRIDSDSRFVYMTTRSGQNTHLYIGQYASPLDTSGSPPNVQITYPFYGDSFIEGTDISVMVNAVDDKHVVTVKLLVNGQTILFDSTPPYRFIFAVPDQVDFLTLSASAVDLAGNIGYSNDISIIVDPDPRTTITGTVFNSGGLPISGASLTTIRGFSTTTASDGTFSIPGVSTVGGDIRVDVIFTDNDGTVFSGFSDTVSPVSGGTTDVGDVVLFPQMSDVAAGGNHTCAVHSNGKVNCWGYNGQGQVGIQNVSPWIESTPVLVGGISSATKIAAGDNHTCVILSNKTLRCWGSNNKGQLGNINVTSSFSFTPVPVTGISNAVSIAAGEAHTCAALADGTVRCWGRNDFGTLGDGTLTISTAPVSVVGINNAVAVTAGSNHSCALLGDGTIKCWGWNRNGQLGIGTATGPETCSIYACSTRPVLVSGISIAVAIGSGNEHTCALLSNGTLRCWGANSSGQLGIGTLSTFETTPVTVSGINNAISISAGIGQHSCATLSNGMVKCWGSNLYGQLGTGSLYGPQYCGFYYCGTVPFSVTGVSKVVVLSAGQSHSCAFLLDGTGRCWGYNTRGQLGNGSHTTSSPFGIPYPVGVLGF